MPGCSARAEPGREGIGAEGGRAPYHPGPPLQAGCTPRFIFSGRPLHRECMILAAGLVMALRRSSWWQSHSELGESAGCVVHFVNSKAEPVPQAPQLFAVGTETSSARFGTPASSASS